MTPAATQRHGRRGQGERTREEILAAAEAILLRTASEDEVSIRAVADAVGVTAPSIYRHFPDKAHLLFEVCSRQFDRMNAEVAAALAEAGTADPERALAAVAGAYVRFGVGNPEHYRIMFMGRADHTPDQYADEQVLETGCFGTVVDLVGQAIAAGALREDLTDPLAVAHALWSAIHGVVSIEVAKPNMPGPPLEARVATMLDVVFRGISRDRRQTRGGSE